MKSKRLKIIFALIAVLICFFVITFYQKWGVTLAEKATSDYSSKVKSVRNNFNQATKVCPKIIKSLEAGIPQLQKNNVNNKLMQSYKLIADCQTASHQYADAAKNYQKLAETEPQVAKWHGEVAQSLLNAGNAGEALRVSHLAVQLESDNFEYRLLEARILAKLNLTNRAIAAYQQAIRIAPYQALTKTETELNALLTRNDPTDQQGN